MPGYVEEMSRASEEVNRHADRYDQTWDVNIALRENLHDVRVAHPELSHGEHLQRAVSTTKNEIVSNWEQEQRVLEEHYGQRESNKPQQSERQSVRMRVG